MATSDRIETLLDEQRSFPPPAAFRSAAHVQDERPYKEARRDREGYWANWAKQLEWIRRSTLPASKPAEPSGNVH